MPVSVGIKSELRIYSCPTCNKEELFTLNNLPNILPWRHKYPNTDINCPGYMGLSEIWTDRDQWQEIVDKDWCRGYGY